MRLLVKEYWHYKNARYKDKKKLILLCLNAVFIAFERDSKLVGIQFILKTGTYNLQNSVACELKQWVKRY